MNIEDYRKKIMSINSSLDFSSSLKKISSVILLIPSELSKLNNFLEISSIAFKEDENIYSKFRLVIDESENVIKETQSLNKDRRNNANQGFKQWRDCFINIREPQKQLEVLIDDLKEKSDNKRYEITYRSIVTVAHVSGPNKVKNKIIDIIKMDLENIIYLKEVLKFSYDIEKNEDIRVLAEDLIEIISIFNSHNKNDINISKVYDIISVYEKIEKWSNRSI